jgi:hypothetical protein
VGMRIRNCTLEIQHPYSFVGVALDTTASTGELDAKVRLEKIVCRISLKVVVADEMEDETGS